MKKIIALLLLISTLTMCVMLSSCKIFGGEQIEIAMITDGGDVSNSSMNQAVWESIADFAIMNGKSYDAYHPSEGTHESRVDCMMKAVVAGARVVVCSGRLLEKAVFEVQDLFPSVQFIFVDGEPRGIEEEHKKADTSSADESIAAPEVEKVKISDNVYCITFREEQAGYLAGYVAVRDGYTKFGFMSESDSEADRLYGVGFLQGVDVAAEEMGISSGVSVKYRYSGHGSSDEEIYKVSKSWFMSGTELIFASGHNSTPVIEAAETANGRVICTDSNHSSVSDLVVTSAMKFVDESISEALKSVYGNQIRWDAEHSGKSVKLGVLEGGVGLPTTPAAWRCGNFSVEKYEEIVAKIVGGEIRVQTNNDIFNEHHIAIEFKS